jgi:hypothetical protein
MRTSALVGIIAMLGIDAALGAAVSPQPSALPGSSIQEAAFPRGGILPGPQRLREGMTKVHSVPQANSTLALVALAERRFTERVQRCDSGAASSAFTGCVSDALDQFSADLAQPKVDLPLQLRQVPQHLSRAAAEVRAAPAAAPRRTQRAAPAPAPAPQAPAAAPEPPAPAAPAESAAERRETIDRAREAVATAVTEIRKDIALLEATEETAEIQQIQTRTGEIVAVSLERLDDRLLEAVEI